jgi:hypothetical protein
VRIARFIPGFRSGKLWKKVVAGIFYCFCFIGVIASADNSSNIFTYVNWLILPFVFFNIYGLIKKKVQWYLPVFFIAMLIINTYISQYIESGSENESFALPMVVMVVTAIIFIVITVRLVMESKHKNKNNPPISAITGTMDYANNVSTVVKAKSEETIVNTFAEIELSDKPKTSLYVKEKIASGKQKNPYKVFKEMRTFGRTSNDYYAYIDSAGVFIQQAKFMESFIDDCETFTPLDAYYTTYAHMNDAQLRTYFAWRTKVKQGQIEDTSLSYAFCYIYELLNNIGIINANDGIDKLLSIWNGFRVYNAKIDAYLTEWIKDYFVVNCPKDRFDAIVCRFPVSYKTKGELFDKLNFGIWDINLVEMYSRHKTTRMAFYKNGNQKVIESCLNAVFTALNALFKENGIDLINLYISVSPNGYYTPFRGAVYAHGKCRDTTVKINDYEIYNCKNGNWSIYEYKCTYFQATKGYILKTIEIEMRKALGGKQSLGTPKTDEISVELREGHRSWNQVKEWRKKAYELLKSKTFAQTIQVAVQDYCKTADIIIKDGEVTEIRPIEIDLSKLDKIREEHEATAKKLIIEEHLEEETVAPPIELEQNAPPEQTVDSSGFTGLVNSFNSDEIELIIKLLKTEQIPQNCELLIESINEKSLTAIDDNLIGYIDELPCVYEEYEDELKISLGGDIYER